MSDLLFAYGTLLPGESRWTHLRPFVVDEGRVDHVQGSLFDTGCGFPAAVFGATGVVHGRVFQLRAEVLDDGLAEIDRVESAAAGGFRRVRVTTAGDRDVWTYEYGGGLQLVPIPSGSWIDRADG